MIHINFDAVIYPYSFIALLFDFGKAKAFKKAKKILKRVGVEIKGDFSDAYGWHFKSMRANQSIICINTEKGRDTANIIKTIRHESQHAAANVFDFIRHKGKLDSEPFQYLNDFIFITILKAYNLKCNIFTS